MVRFHGIYREILNLWTLLKKSVQDNETNDCLFNQTFALRQLLDKNLQLYSTSNSTPFLVVCDLNDELNVSFLEICSILHQHLNHQYVIIQNAKSVKHHPHTRGGLCKQTIGIPQGSIVAPLLCALHFASFDIPMKEQRDLLLRWVDDFLFISWNKRNAYQFIHSLLHERIWGGNVNFDKLCSNDEGLMQALCRSRDQDDAAVNGDVAFSQEKDSNECFTRDDVTHTHQASSQSMIEWASLQFAWGVDGKVNIMATHGKKSSCLWSSTQDTVTVFDDCRKHMNYHRLSLLEVIEKL